MRRELIAGGLALVMLSGCATVRESRFNPMNWFGRSEPVQQTTVDGQPVTVLQTLAPRKGYPAFTDTRPLAPALADVSIQRSASGGIVTATAAVPALGYYDAELVPVPSERSDTLVFDFRLRPPSTAQGTGNEAQRRITAARALSFPELEGVRRIVVNAANGARQVRR